MLKIFSKSNQKQNNVKDRQRGAVTVFLTIILVPCIVCTCLFSDLSRVQLSKSQAQSAADLSLYTVLSHYDPQLKELYGLVASVQDMDDYIAKAEAYFTGMMKAAGIEGQESQFFTDYMRGMFKGDGSINDFLQVEFTKPADISPMDNGTMKNPALLEDGVVEFMKYRGVITIVDKLIDRFSSLDLKQVDNASDYEPVGEAKKEYAEAESELLKDAFYSYFAMKQYQDALQKHAKDHGITAAQMGDHYQKIADDMKKIWRDLFKVTFLITAYYAATDHIENLNFRPYFDPNLYEEKLDSLKESISIVVEDPDNTKHYYITNTMFDQYIKNYNDSYTNLTERVTQITEALRNVDNGDNIPIYMMRVQNAVGKDNCSDFHNKTKKFLDAHKVLNIAIDCESDPDEPIVDTDWKKTIEDLLKDKTPKIQKNYGNADFMILTQPYENCNPASVVEKVINREYTFTSEFLGKDVKLGEFTNSVSKALKNEITYIDDQIANLTRIIDGETPSITGGKLSYVPSLAKLKKDADEYSKKLNQWGSQIDSHSGNPYVSGDKMDKEQYQEVITGSSKKVGQTDGQEVSQKVTAETVEELKTRLVNIRNDLQNMKSAIIGFKYGGRSLSDMTNHDYIPAARTVIPTDPNQININLSGCQTQANEYAPKLISPTQESSVYNPPAINTAKNGNHPDLDSYSPDVYAFFKDKFKDYDPNQIKTKVEDNDKKMDEYKKKGEQARESVLEYDTYLFKQQGGDLTGYTSGAASSSLFEAISGIVNLVRDILSGNSDELRDRIYVVEYMMDMFTHATYANEGWYARAKEKGEEKHANDIVALSEEYLDAWKSADPTKNTDNITLTNYLRGKETNFAHLGEIEYILYGKGSLEGNLNASFGNIFKIRETMNLVSGFVNFYPLTQDTTSIAINSIANSIAAATAGIVPPCITKVILIGVLATLESAKDLDYIKRGVPVTLYKIKGSNWFYSLDTKLEPGDEPAKPSGADFKSDLTKSEPEDPNGLRYTDYLYLFLLSAAQTPGTYSGMITRMGTVMESNMKKVFELDSYSMSKATVYYKLSAQLRVKPLMLSMPIVQSYDTGGGANASDAIQSTDWCTYDINFIRGYS